LSCERIIDRCKSLTPSVGENLQAVSLWTVKRKLGSFCVKRRSILDCT